MLYEHPIVTLIGPGGVGKTRLSIEVAQHVALGVVWFCELAEVTDRVGVCEVVAEQLGIKLQMQDPVIQVGRAISARRDSLVILDNAEQAADAVAEALLVWQPMAPNTRFLVTSRQPLQLGIERPFLLNPLAEEDAVRLFIARARRHAPMFTVTEEGVRTLNQIVEQLDYLPLAIELAAARASLLEPTQILERLDHRFHLLRARERGRSDRQATLRGTILWSWDMLPPWTRLALAQCSVFRGGFSIEAAEAVIEIDAWPEAPWPMDAVHELLDRSLLRVRRGPDGNNRLTQYVSIRAFSEEKFAEEGSIEGPQGEVLTGAAAVARAYRRHGEFYAQLGNDEWLRRLHTHNGFYHLRILKIEMDNLTAGARRSVGADWEEEGAFCTLASAMVADQQGPYEEAAIVLEQALLDFTEVTSATRATLLETLGRIRSRQG